VLEVEGAIKQIGADVMDRTLPREEVVNRRTYDDIIATVALTELTKLFPKATVPQILDLAENERRQMVASAVGKGGDVGVVLASSLLAGGTPTAVNMFERVERVLSQISGIPGDRAGALASVVFTLGLLLAAAAIPLGRPHLFRQRNRAQNQAAVEALEKLFRGNLIPIREKIADGKPGDVARLCREQIAQLAGLPPATAQTAARRAENMKIVRKMGYLGAAALAGSIAVATVAKSGRQMEQELATLIKNPGYAFYLQKNPDEHSRKQLELFLQGLSPSKGADDLRQVAGNVGTNIGRVITGERRPPFSPDVSPKK
jgi:hypothetical protein